MQTGESWTPQELWYLLLLRAWVCGVIVLMSPAAYSLLSEWLTWSGFWKLLFVSLFGLFWITYVVFLLRSIWVGRVGGSIIVAIVVTGCVGVLVVLGWLGSPMESAFLLRLLALAGLLIWGVAPLYMSIRLNDLVALRVKELGERREGMSDDGHQDVQSNV